MIDQGNIFRQRSVMFAPGLSVVSVEAEQGKMDVCGDNSIGYVDWLDESICDV